LRSLLERRGTEVVPIVFSGRHNHNEGGVPFIGNERRFFMPPEAQAEGLEYPKSSTRVTETCLSLFRRERLDALHIVEWMPVGMALWDAALRWGGPTAFTPTEYGAICQYGFLLNNCGTSCAGPENGTKCSQCTHSLEPYPPPRSFFEPWYSKRHRLFHGATQILPDPIRRRALWVLSERFQAGHVAISATEGSARLAAARRFLTTVGTVAYQSPQQHRVFERTTGVKLCAPLPLVMPLSLENALEKNLTSTHPVVFLFAARPNFDRGLWLLLDAWKRWKPTKAAARLLLHTHDDGSRIARSVRELQDQGCDVRLAFGPLDEQSLREIHRSVHFVVNPAVWEEPGSSTVIEGLFFGTPAIVPSQTGSADFVKPGANGYHYQFRDVDDLLEKLRTAVEEVGGWRHLHEGALQSARHYRRLSDLHVEMLYERLFNRH